MKYSSGEEPKASWRPLDPEKKSGNLCRRFQAGRITFSRGNSASVLAGHHPHNLLAGASAPVLSFLALVLRFLGCPILTGSVRVGSFLFPLLAVADFLMPNSQSRLAQRFKSD